MSTLSIITVAGYAAAVILWICALREVRRTGEGYSLLVGGWAAWAVGAMASLMEVSA